MKTTIRNVAEAAGVSAMAVSNVLHGGGRNVKVSEEKAAHIRRIAREMRYEANDLARSLRSRRTRMVGVVFQHLTKINADTPYFPLMLNGVMSALFEADYTLGLCPKLVKRSSHGAISDGRFDGVLWCRPDYTDSSAEGLRLSTTPVVMMHAPVGSVPGISTFCADNAMALKLAVDHLVGLGHRSIAFVRDPINVHTAEGKDRAVAFETAMEQHGLAGELLTWGYDAEEVFAYKGSNRPHTGLICYSDTIAGKILEVSKAVGIRVPEELSVIGFDSSRYCDDTEPPLTSIFQPVEQMAQEATQHLLTLIECEPEGRESLTPLSSTYACRLDLRGSTSSPKLHTPQ